MWTDQKTIRKLWFCSILVLLATEAQPFSTSAKEIRFFSNFLSSESVRRPIFSPRMICFALHLPSIKLILAVTIPEPYWKSSDKPQRVTWVYSSYCQKSFQVTIKLKLIGFSLSPCDNSTIKTWAPKFTEISKDWKQGQGLLNLGSRMNASF